MVVKISWNGLILKPKNQMNQPALSVQFVRSSGGVVVKLLACGARGRGLDS